jgi:hypothetical protein
MMVYQKIRFRLHPDFGFAQGFGFAHAPVEVAIKAFHEGEAGKIGNDPNFP